MDCGAKSYMYPLKTLSRTRFVIFPKPHISSNVRYKTTLIFAADYFNLRLILVIINNYLLTESEVFTVKY